MSEKFWGGQEDRRNRSGYRGNSKKENQRNKLLIEMYGHDRARLEMEAHQRPEQHISETLASIMKSVKLDDKIQFSDLLDQWEELVGTALSTLCRPHAIDNKTLMIEVDHASAMHVLETYKKKEILQRVKTVCRDVLSIRFVPSGSKI